MIRDFRISVLGSGTSAGVPAIGCGCETCLSGDWRDARTRTSAAVEWVDGDGEERCVLIDAGPDLRQQALRHGLRRCDGVFVTHTHTDHIFGIDELRRFNAVMEGHPPIPVWAESASWVHLRRVYEHIFERHRNANESFVATLLEHHLEVPGGDGGGAGRCVELFGVRFTPVRVLHGRLPVVAYRVEAVEGVEGVEGEGGGGVLPAAWVTDVSRVPPGSWGALGGLGTLFLDGLRWRRHPTHLTVGQAESVSLEIGARRTFLIHVAHEVLHGRDEGGLVEGVRFGVDGLTLREGAGGAEGWVERGGGVRESYGWALGGVRGVTGAALGAGR